MAISRNKISIIIPVKNNQSGIDLFLKKFFEYHSAENYPLEIIIVDNNSDSPVRLPDIAHLHQFKIKVIKCQKPGPASARNYGAQHASGEWFLFVDSDCIPTEHMIEGYANLESDAVGFQGLVNALGKDTISQYYESQQIHRPPGKKDKTGNVIPKCLVSANIFIKKDAFQEIDGFNESYIFGGEDIDFGLRLTKIGQLEFADKAVVLHNYDDGLKGFIRRFIEYGKGNRLVEKYQDIHLIPLPFTAKNKRIATNHLLAVLQWLCLLTGYIQMHWKIRKEV